MIKGETFITLKAALKFLSPQEIRMIFIYIFTAVIFLALIVCSPLEARICGTHTDSTETRKSLYNSFVKCFRKIPYILPFHMFLINIFGETQWCFRNTIGWLEENIFMDNIERFCFQE